MITDGPALPAPLVAALRAADLPDEAIYLAGQAASWAPALADDQRRAWALLVAAALEAQRRGGTRLVLPAADGPAPAFLDTFLSTPGIADADRRAALALAARLDRTPVLGEIVGARGEYKPFIVDGGCLYHQRVLTVEERLAAALRGRLQAAPAALTDEVRAATENAGGGLSDEQRAATAAVFTRPLTVITGGPGTGKTSVIVAVLRAARALGIAAADVALAAPTGKAAQRITESLIASATGAAPAAQTLHRLLGYQPARGGTFRHHRHYPLPHRLVIVDEGSMIDLFLMERLLGALAPDARLVLLGDADQLPSVDAGAVFRDLAPWAIALTRNFRADPATAAGRSILTAAAAVRGGRAEDLGLTARTAAADLTFEGAEQLPPPARRPAAALDDFLERWQARATVAFPQQAPLLRTLYRFAAGRLDPAQADDLAALHAGQHHQRILCVTRGAARSTGAEAVNAALHRRLLAHDPRAREEGGPFAAGEPLLMLRNDYERALFNGDLAICVRARFDGGPPTLAAAFPRGDGFVALPVAALAGDLALAHAMTVHRAQGSEIDTVALILPDQDLPLLTRELVYTALTRARRSAVILGAPALLRQAIARPIDRTTGLAARLGALSPR